MGAATADALYGCVAGFGLTVISAFLIEQRFWLQVIGGVFLCYLGARTLRSQPATEAASAGGNGLLSSYVSTFFLTITNPMTILSFAAIFAGLGVVAAGGDLAAACWLVSGVFLGSAAWWLFLSMGVSLLREKVSSAALRWVNRLSGVVLLAFGALALWQAAV
jgi:threonine/homoserine/homoserine lactone efflux protein